MNIISTNNSPLPAGHYSQAVEHNGLLYISGQLPINPRTMNKKVGSIEEQTQQVLSNVEAILVAANSAKDKVLKVTVYISEISLWDQVNTVYAQFFGDHKPARVIVPSNTLHFGFQIEMEAIAIINNTKK